MNWWWGSRDRRSFAGSRRVLAIVTVAGCATLVAPLAQSLAGPAQQRPACTAEKPDRAGAVAAARACGTEVEVAAERSETTRVFAQPNGNYVAEIAAMPQRVHRTDGSWAPIDTSLRGQPDGSFAPGATTLPVRFSRGGTGPFARVPTAAGEWTLTWPAALPEPRIEGDAAVYPNVLSGVDLRVHARPSGLSYLFVIRTRQALADPAVRRLAVGVSGPVTRQNGTDGLAVKAPDGSVVLSSAGASMWDSAGGGASAEGPGDTARTAPVRVEVAGTDVALLPDSAMLADPGLVLPVYVDPQIDAPRPRWAYADDTSSNRNDGIARVGVNPDGSGLYRSYFEFSLSSLAQTHILAASFLITLIHSYSCGPTPVSLYFTTGIDGGVNGTRTSWNSNSLLARLDTHSANAHKMSGTVKVCSNDPQPDVGMTFTGSLASNLQSWVNQSWSAVTLGLATTDSNGANERTGSWWKKFNPGTAVLRVLYNTVPATPAASGLSTVGTSQTLACWTSGTSGQPTVNTTNGAQLVATLRDNETGDRVVARYEWQDLTAGTPVTALPDTPGFTTPHTYQVNLPSSSLPDGHSIQWRVHGFDGTDNGGSSAWCHLLVDNTAPGQPALASTALPPFPATPPASTVVGSPGAVTITPAAGDTDVVGYYFGVGAVDPVPTIWAAADAGGTAVIPVVPVVSGLAKNFLSVVAVDAAGNRSPVAVSAPDAPGTRQFRANAGSTAPPAQADLTGDRKADAVGIYDAGNNQTQLWNFDTTADGAGVFAPTIPITNDPNAFPVAKIKPLSGDFNGDGRADLAVMRDDGGCRTTIWWWLADGNGYAPSNGPVWDSGPGTFCWGSVKPVAGDFTGDGRTDLAAFYDYGNSWTKIWLFIARADGTGFDSSGPAFDSGAGNWDWSHTKAVAGDFTGDGKADIAALYDYNGCTSAVWLFASNGTSFTPTRPWISATGGWCWAASTPFAGDLNGDGIADFSMFYRYSATLWKTFTWTGPSLNAVVQTAQTTTSTDASLMRLVSGDVNGDGKSDVAFFYDHGNSQTKLWLMLSTGTAFGAETVLWDSGPGRLSWSRLTTPA
jgi:hypothetical protein